MSIRVVNLKSYRTVENEVLVRVDRQSVLGNPFKMRFPTPAQSKRPEFEINERNRVCDAYAEYFNKKVEEQGAFRNEVIRIYRLVKSGKDVALGCWCYPKRCHAEYIKKFIESYIEEPKGSSDPFKYRVIFRIANAKWQILDDVLDKINACAIADEALECMTYRDKPIIGVKVIEKATHKCVYEASR